MGKFLRKTRMCKLIDAVSFDRGLFECVSYKNFSGAESIRFCLGDDLYFYFYHNPKSRYMAFEVENDVTDEYKRVYIGDEEYERIIECLFNGAKYAYEFNPSDIGRLYVLHQFIDAQMHTRP